MDGRGGRREALLSAWFLRRFVLLMSGWTLSETVEQNREGNLTAVKLFEPEERKI